MSLPSNANLPLYPGFANARAYDAEFLRMIMQSDIPQEGIAPITLGAAPTDLQVTTGASGLNVSAAAGRAYVQGDTRTTQGTYFCYVPVANTVTIPAAHATLPRIDAIILKVEDADASGSVTQWSVTYQSGTAIASAQIANGPGSANFLLGGPGQASGPALQASALVLAYVYTPALFAGPYVNATHIWDYRPHFMNRGLCKITGAEALTSVAYSAMPTVDVVRNIIMPTDGMIGISYNADYLEAVLGAGRAAIFMNATQLSVATAAASPIAQETAARTGPINTYNKLGSTGAGLAILDSATAYLGDVTTGQVVGGGSPVTLNTGPCYVKAAAGRYDIGVKLKSTSGAINLKNRELRVWGIPF